MEFDYNFIMLDILHVKSMNMKKKFNLLDKNN